MPGKWGRKKKSADPSTQSVTHVSATIDHTVISDSDMSKPAKTKKVTPKRKLSVPPLFAKYKKLLAIAVVLIVVGVAGGLIYRANNKPKVATPNGCSAELLDRAKPTFQPGSVEQLELIVKEIESIPNHHDDPNCLYVTLTYYINMSDGVNAKVTLDTLEKIYDPKVGYDKTISRSAKAPQELRPTVDFLAKQAERYKNVRPDGAPR